MRVNSIIDCHMKQRLILMTPTAPNLARFFSVSWIRPKGRVDGGNQLLTTQGFRQVGRSSVSQTFFPQCRLVVSGNDDDRQMLFGQGQGALHVPAGHVRHLVVEHHAIRPTRFQRAQELMSACEHFYLIRERAQQASEGETHRFLVVHDRDERPRPLIHPWMKQAICDWR